MPSDLSAVKSYDDLSADHTPDDVDYPQSPPVGGEHAPEWLECGAYDVPVREENAVHDLEHGTVWISYDPDLGADDVAALAELLPQNGIMAPYPGLDSPVVVTVWGRQLALDGADDPRLRALHPDVRRRGDRAGAERDLRGRHPRPRGRRGLVGHRGLRSRQPGRRRSK